MSKSKKISVLGISVTIREDDYISLTDIARSGAGQKPKDLIRNWLKN